MKDLSTPIELLQKIAKDPDGSIGRGGASNPNTPVETLVELEKDNEWLVRNAVAKKPNTPKKQVANMLGGKSGGNMGEHGGLAICTAGRLSP